MAVVTARVCSNCGKNVPVECDGRTYRVSDWERRVCHGSDEDSFYRHKGELRFKIVMGHGSSYDVTPVPAD